MPFSRALTVPASLLVGNLERTPAGYYAQSGGRSVPLLASRWGYDLAGLLEGWIPTGEMGEMGHDGNYLYVDAAELRDEVRDAVRPHAVLALALEALSQGRLEGGALEFPLEHAAHPRLARLHGESYLERDYQVLIKAQHGCGYAGLALLERHLIETWGAAALQLRRPLPDQVAPGRSFASGWECF